MRYVPWIGHAVGDKKGNGSKDSHYPGPRDPVTLA